MGLCLAFREACELSERGKDEQNRKKDAERTVNRHHVGASQNHFSISIRIKIEVFIINMTARVSKCIIAFVFCTLYRYMLVWRPRDGSKKNVANFLNHSESEQASFTLNTILPVTKTSQSFFIYFGIQVAFS